MKLAQLKKIRVNEPRENLLAGAPLRVTAARSSPTGYCSQCAARA